jgi:predicted glycoside hydrolase/deacetylase ChbG (UPF0249 family)
MKTMIRLITRGDDLGSFQAANHAIVDAHRNGILKNTSVMVPAPAFAHGAELLKAEKGLCLGLHITLTAEWDAPRWGPVAPREKVRSLIDEQGFFFSDPLKIHQHGVNLDELMLEIQTQLDLARKAGLKIEYVDEHMGVSWIHPEGKPDSRLSSLLGPWCKKEGLVWDQSIKKDPLPELENKTLSFKENFLRRLETAGPGTYLLVTHPAYDTPEMQAVTSSFCPAGTLGKSREADYKLLCDPEFVHSLRNKGVEIIKYTDAENSGGEER